MAKHGYKKFKPTVRTDERKEWRDAVFQYLIDHGIWTGRLWQTTIHFEDKKDFEWRIKSRMFGVRRNDVEEAKKEVAVFLADFGSYKAQQSLNAKMSHRIQEIDKTGNVLDRIVLWFYRKSRNYLKV